MAETRANADTTDIDELIKYIESPEYLRMTARQQDESPGALLSSSRTQEWVNADGTTYGSRSVEYSTGDQLTITEDHAWSSPLMTGDVVTVQFVDLRHDPTQPDSIRVEDHQGQQWWVGFESVRATTDEDREAFAARVAPETGTFGIVWNTDTQRCECTSCNDARERALGVSSPAVTRVREGERPLNLTTRSDFTSFGNALAERRAFRTRGALRGVLRPESNTPGYLSVKAPNASALWAADLGKIDYVVYSYNTPIAYHVASPTFNEWIYPDVSYSRTTSRHQTKIKAALTFMAQNLDANVRWLPTEG